jgi:hypothetical protein
LAKEREMEIACDDIDKPIDIEMRRTLEPPRVRKF